MSPGLAAASLSRLSTYTKQGFNDAFGSSRLTPRRAPWRSDSQSEMISARLTWPSRKGGARMSLRFHAFTWAAFGIALLVIPSQGAEPAAKDQAKASKSWTLPRTPDGQPDFQGYWTNATYIPLERPKALG